MTNKKLFLGVLVMVLVFGVTGTVCANEGGTFTLTGIPARLNDMYAFLGVEDRNVVLFGVQSIDMATEAFIISRISNGNVNMPMWVVDCDDSVSRYNGNHSNLEVFIIIKDSRTFSFVDDVDDWDAVILFESVTFSNGSARRAFQDNDGFVEL